MRQMYYECTTLLRIAFRFHSPSSGSCPVFPILRAPGLALTRSSMRFLSLLPRTLQLIAVIPSLLRDRAVGAGACRGGALWPRRMGSRCTGNAPPREDDVEGQIALLSKVADRPPGSDSLTPDEGRLALCRTQVSQEL
jgi:hypothetical protein